MFWQGPVRASATINRSSSSPSAAPSFGQGDEAARRATSYENLQCGCCEAYADHLRENGFTVTVVATHDMPMIKREAGVPSGSGGCHTTMAGGYVVEGHVPVSALERPLSERPDIKRISPPGMPPGSPGMTGTKTGPFTIYELSNEAWVYAVE